MSYTRNMYDRANMANQLAISMGPGQYLLYDGKYENRSQSRVPIGYTAGNDVAYSSAWVDVENTLRGQGAGGYYQSAGRLPEHQPFKLPGYARPRDNSFWGFIKSLF